MAYPICLCSFVFVGRIVCCGGFFFCSVCLVVLVHLMGADFVGGLDFPMVENVIYFVIQEVCLAISVVVISR